MCRRYNPRFPLTPHNAAPHDWRGLHSRGPIRRRGRTRLEDAPLLPKQHQLFQRRSAFGRRRDNSGSGLTTARGAFRFPIRLAPGAARTLPGRCASSANAATRTTDSTKKSQFTITPGLSHRCTDLTPSILTPESAICCSPTRLYIKKPGSTIIFLSAGKGDPGHEQRKHSRRHRREHRNRPIAQLQKGLRQP